MPKETTYPSKHSTSTTVNGEMKWELHKLKQRMQSQGEIAQELDQVRLKIWTALKYHRDTIEQLEQELDDVKRQYEYRTDKYLEIHEQFSNRRRELAGANQK